MSIPRNATLLSDGQGTSAAPMQTSLMWPRGLTRRYRSREQIELHHVGQVWGLLWLNSLPWFCYRVYPPHSALGASK